MDRTWHSNRAAVDAPRFGRRVRDDTRSRALIASPGDACNNTPLVGTESGALTRVP